MIQHQFWLSHQLQPESSAYNIPSVFKICGRLHISALEHGLNQIIQRHESLRTTFTAKQGRFERAIAPSLTIELPITNLCNLAKDEQSKKQWQLINAEISRPFALSSGPLIRTQLLQLDQQEFILVIVMHHIITDLAAKDIFAAELSALYNALSIDNSLPTLMAPIQYSNYVTWQEKWSNSPESAKMLQFWQHELGEHDSLINLPCDHPRPPTATSLGSAQWFQLSAAQSIAVQEFSRQRSVAPFITLLTCYLVVLARYCRQNDITIGVPLSNRRREDDKKVMGCFVNILPLALQLPPEMSFAEALQLVRKKLLMAHRNQETSFDEIVAVLQPSRDPSYNPVFQVGFTFEPPMHLQFNNLHVEPLTTHNQGAQLDLFLKFWEINPIVQGYFEYNNDLFAPETIGRLSKHYQNLLAVIIKHPDEPVSKLAFLTPEENNKLLLEWNNTKTDYGKPLCLHTLFEQQVEKSPDAMALLATGTQLSYRELNARANQLAHYLQAQGIGPDDLVAICMERSVEMVIAIYGILKAGAAYVPMEPEFPKQRLSFILTETKAKVVLTQAHLQSRCTADSGTAICLDTEWFKIASYPATNPVSQVTTSNLAYVIYTSGSTGTPKGVMIEHQAIFNRLQWMQATFALEPGDRVLQKTPFSFDVSVWEFFWPLLTGACLVVAPVNAHKDPIKICDFIQQQGVTTIHFVPSMLRLFLDTGKAGMCTSLRQVMCSGEALSWELQTALLQQMPWCGLHNLYGPTEAAVDVSYWRCTNHQHQQKVPIGFPIANTQLYILDEHLRPVAQGTVGELYIGGVQVARGYLQRPELNAKTFIPDPFTQDQEARLYKTGDLARYLPDGAIEYLGRVDFQVKLYGNRIELDEIRTALCRHPGVKEAVVILHTTTHGKQQLVAYLLSAVTESRQLQLPKHLANLLPDYMIPSKYILMAEFPLTSSGKIDRKMLPDPEVYREEEMAAAMPESGGLSVRIAAKWQKILDRSDIGPHDNFFDAGGNSLLATQLSLDLELDLGVEIPLVKIFQYPTIAALADFLQDTLRSAKSNEMGQERARLQRQALARRRKN